MKVDLFLTPMPFTRANLEKRTVVIIDVLRFCTSVCAALTSDAKGVIPTVGPGEAGEMWSKLGPDLAILAGERGGLRIENFQLGNSPAEFTAEAVRDRIVVMTTTNGTTVFSRIHNAGAVICCALVNIARVAKEVAEIGQDLVVVCSGEEGGFSIEDTVCGGMLIHLLGTDYKKSPKLNDAGSLALLLYRANKTAIRRTIEQGEHGRRLAELGFAEDVAIAAEINSLPVLPVLKEGKLVPGGEGRD